MICGGENGTSGCHLAGFSEDVAFACHFVATLPPYRSATDIGYTSKKLSKMAGNLASHSLDSWWIDRLFNSYTMGMSGLPDIYTRGPRVYISGEPRVPVV